MAGSVLVPGMRRAWIMSSHGSSQVHLGNHLHSLPHSSCCLTCLSSWMKSSTMALMHGAFGECRMSCSVFRENSRELLPFSSTDSTSANLGTQASVLRLLLPELGMQNMGMGAHSKDWEWRHASTHSMLAFHQLLMAFTLRSSL